MTMIERLGSDWIASLSISSVKSGLVGWRMQRRRRYFPASACAMRGMCRSVQCTKRLGKQVVMQGTPLQQQRGLGFQGLVHEARSALLLWWGTRAERWGRVRDRASMLQFGTGGGVACRKEVFPEPGTPWKR